MRLRIGIGLALTWALLCLWPGSIEAGGPLPTLSYRGGGHGKVVFDHQRHASEGFRCNDCQGDFAGTGKALFATRRQGLIAFADHTTGAKCFACHNNDGVPDDRKNAFSNGKGAFDTCDRCHRQSGAF